MLPKLLVNTDTLRTAFRLSTNWGSKKTIVIQYYNIEYYEGYTNESKVSALMTQNINAST